MDTSFYVSMYIQDEYRRLYAYFFGFIVYCDCYILFIVACCPIRATGGRGVFVSFRQTACIYNYDFS